MKSVLIIIHVVILSIGLFDANIEAANNTLRPVVLWHGTGDNCCEENGIGGIKTLIEKVPGIYVVSIKIGDTLEDDLQNSFFLGANRQIQMVCDMIQNDNKLKHGFNAIGFSQGALLMRGLIQRCPNPPVHNLISIGGPHQGIYGLPDCNTNNNMFCNNPALQRVLSYFVYESWAQRRMIHSSYWHDPLNEEDYRERSIFLSDINNEKDINQEYINNLQKLNKFVMVRFENDTVVKPIESEWFGFYAPGQAKDTIDFEKLRTFTRLGLDTMKSKGQLEFLSVKNEHIRFSSSWFITNIIQKYLL